MILILAFVAAASQPAFYPPPAPPGPASPGTPAFERERDQYAATLRSTCLSERGVALIVASWARSRAEAIAAMPEGRSLSNELAAAALTAPIDIARLERAVEANRRWQQGRSDAYDRERLANLRALSPADRVIYARGFTAFAPTTPARICPPPAPPRR